MAIIKKEAILSPVSPNSIETYLGYMSFYINYFQNKSSNINPDGSFIDLWTADIFDGKTDQLWRLFSEEAAGINSMPLTTFPAGVFTKGTGATTNYPETKSTKVQVTKDSSSGGSFLIK